MGARFTFILFFGVEGMTAAPSLFVNVLHEKQKLLPSSLMLRASLLPQSGQLTCSLTNVIVVVSYLVIFVKPLWLSSIL
jgi:hypothetical protein